MVEQQFAGLLRRPVVTGDEPFLFALYASTRTEELAQVVWPPGVQALFLRQQFQAQQTHYASYYPQGEHELLLYDNTPIGRLYLDRGVEQLHLLDIALLPEWRGKGIGGALMRELLNEATARAVPVTLHVYSLDQRVLHWYERLGFAIVGSSGLYHLMERKPD